MKIGVYLTFLSKGINVTKKLTGSSEPAAHITKFHNIFLMKLSNATHPPHPPQYVDVRSAVGTRQTTVNPRIEYGVY